MADHKRNHAAPRSRMLRSLAVLGAVLVTGVAFAGGCTGDDSPPDEPGSAGSSGAASADPPVTTRVSVGRVAGRLDKESRQELKSEVTEVVDSFLDSAYLGDFPRSSFEEAYAAFTGDARRDAERDADLLSNAEISDQIDLATATKRHLSLDVLAVQGRARGVTARFTLDFETTGDLERAERVKGSVFIVPQGEGWKIFGYDITRSVTA